MKKTYKTDTEEITQGDLECLERTLLRWWKRLHPKWELLIVSLPKDDKHMRQRILKHITEIYTSEAYEQYCIACGKNEEMQQGRDDASYLFSEE